MKTLFTVKMFIVILFCATVQAQTGGNYTVTQSVIAGGGGQNSTGGQFSLDGTIGQSVAGDALVGSPFAAISGFWNYEPLSPAATFEADVTPRSTGDGVVDATDIQQIERFSIGFDKPYLSNEGQRADCAPRATGGDGVVDATDIQQAERYSIGFDPKTPTNGPTSVTAPETGSTVRQTNLKSVSKEKPAAPRTLSIQNASAYQGQNATVNILVDAAGDETGYTFSISYNQAKLTNPQIARGGIAGETILSNTTTPGQIGFSVRRGGSNFLPGNGLLLVKATFTVAANATGGTTPVAFTGAPAPESTSDGNANQLATNYIDGTVTINSPTAASVSVSGRVLTHTGRGIRNVVITMTDSQGNTRTASTTNFGNYQFRDVPAGETYIFTARGKRFTFSQNTIVRVITEDTNDINFVADEQSVLPIN